MSVSLDSTTDAFLAAGAILNVSVLSVTLTSQGIYLLFEFDWSDPSIHSNNVAFRDWFKVGLTNQNFTLKQL